MIPKHKLSFLSGEAYHGDLSADSNSSLRIFEKSRERYAGERVFKTMPREAPSADMVFGNFFHSVLLELHTLGDHYLNVPNIDRRTKQGKLDYKTYMEMANGRTMVSSEDSLTALAMREGVMRNPDARAIFEGQGHREASVAWNCPETGLPLKAKYDWLDLDGIIVDLKTCDDISPAGFGRTVMRFRYHCQACLYQEGARQALGLELPFIFVAVSKTFPHECAVYKWEEPRAVFLGCEENLHTLRELAACRQSGDWSGQWSRGLNTLTLPPWAFPRSIA